ncbi:unnamed protein product, partial [Iphiclides podalirius]
MSPTLGLLLILVISGFFHESQAAPRRCGNDIDECFKKLRLEYERFIEAINRRQQRLSGTTKPTTQAPGPRQYFLHFG